MIKSVINWSVGNYHLEGESFIYKVSSVDLVRGYFDVIANGYDSGGNSLQKSIRLNVSAGTLPPALYVLETTALPIRHIEGSLIDLKAITSAFPRNNYTWYVNGCIAGK